MSQVISANRLADGAVVYVSRDGTWAGSLGKAAVFASKEEAEAALRMAQEDAKRNLVVDPGVVEVRDEPGGPRPVTLRESIRALGPTIDFLPPAQAFAYETEPPPDNLNKNLTQQEMRAASRDQPLETARESVG
ncbi:MAG TPA: DUF2849 domain-containing protein [Methylocella sp.]|nr:DUF2849 domain-containing protein [Methylocella sp.]